MINTYDGLGTVNVKRSQTGERIVIVDHPRFGKFSYIDDAIGLHGRANLPNCMEAIEHLQCALKTLNEGETVRTSRGTMYFVDEAKIEKEIQAAINSLKGI